MKHGKRYVTSAKAIERNKLYEVEDAVNMVCEHLQGKVRRDRGAPRPSGR